jgi:hypothetical protein
LTKSIPFAIENQNINMEQLLSSVNLKMQCNENPSAVDIEDDHEDLFEELNAL